MRRTTHEAAWHRIHEDRIQAMTREKAALERLVYEAVRILAPIQECDSAIVEWLARVAAVLNQEVQHRG